MMPSSIPRKSGKAAEQQTTYNRPTVTSNEARPRSTPIDAQHQTTPQPPTDITTIPMAQAVRTVVQEIADNQTFNQTGLHTTPPRNDTRGASPSTSSSPEGPSDEYIARMERLANIQERMAMLPQRRGHRYNSVKLKGNARAIQGNIHDQNNITAIVLGPSHEYVEATAEESAQFLNGDTDPEGARVFLQYGIVPEHSNEEDMHDEDIREDHEMGGTRRA